MSTAGKLIDIESRLRAEDGKEVGGQLLLTYVGFFFFFEHDENVLKFNMMMVLRTKYH